MDEVLIHEDDDVNDYDDRDTAGFLHFMILSMSLSTLVDFNIMNSSWTC